MSWWITLEEPTEVNEHGEHPSVEVARHDEGGTFALGGTTEATLNVTYNYSPFFEAQGVDPGTRLHGRSGFETIEALTNAVVALGTERSENYWERSPGNAGYALSILLAWVRERPDGIWRVNP